MKNYKLTIEQNLSEDESSLLKSVSINLNDYINFDYLLKRINLLNQNAGSILKIGRGGSHIWMSRQDNTRVAIIHFS